ncbi:MAG: DUF2914 domain-containing protein [Deltaproteobacteria bacterium]|nr:DUF2914 domain-containing protein [Deltaproteobacteria bacterium]
MSAAWARLGALRRRYPAVELVLFFAAGFLLDVFTLGRIDRPLVLLRQGLFLCALAALLLLAHRHAVGLFVPRGRWAWAWGFHAEAIHFLFGTLLSNFTLFYFRSAAGWLPRLSLVGLAGLLVVNELPRFRRSGPLVRFSLFCFCLGSYLAYLLPVLAGVVRKELFQLALVLAGAVVAALALGMAGWERAAGQRGTSLRRLALGWGVLAGMYGLYAAGAIPPVPLSVRVMGLYHRVQHVGARYQLERSPVPAERSWRWPWERARFEVREGDKVHLFARVFAPTAFRDRVYVRWMRAEGGGWTTTDRIPLTVQGGREDGYAGYAWKQRFQPGDWRVELETEDGRSMGRMDFELVVDGGRAERTFVTEWR